MGFISFYFHSNDKSVKISKTEASTNQAAAEAIIIPTLSSNVKAAKNDHKQQNNCKIVQKKSFVARAYAINIPKSQTQRESARDGERTSARVEVLVKSNEKHYQQC